MVGGSTDKNDWNNAFYFIADACVIGIILWAFMKPPVHPGTAKADAAV